MSLTIAKITLALPLRMGTVNCYLLQDVSGTVLVDTGTSHGREALVNQLEAAGVVAGELKLIAITHGDFDHTGNAAFLRKRYRAPIGMHAGDAGMASQGDMFYNRKSGNRVVKWLAPFWAGFKKADRFEADIPLADGNTLDAYGIKAQVIEMPGHSSGSIGILTDAGELFSGDLFENSKKPGFSSIMDDPPTAQQSAEKLNSYGITTVYPGHGEPFQWAEFQARGIEEK
jgi:glyoxylase-like metal-dependent hydrolase (beta-lactamase superfamily II)